MNSFWIAYRSIEQRALASGLTMISMALGVMMVVAVLSIHGVISASFRANSNLGYNVIVGAKGGEEQLVLNTVFYLHRPVENIPANYYMEFLSKEKRGELLNHSLALHAAKLREETMSISELGLGGGLTEFAALALQKTAGEIDELRTVEANRSGKYASICEFAIPICLGDFLDRFRVVGTTPDFFDLLMLDSKNNGKYEFAQGRNFVQDDPEHRFFEAVLGARVAREIRVTELTVSIDGDLEKAAKLVRAEVNAARVTVSGKHVVVKLGVNVGDDALLDKFPAAKIVSRRAVSLEVGDEISPSHGAPDGHVHQRRFTIVGILAPNPTPNDRAVFVNMEGFYLMEDHAKPLEADAGAESIEVDDHGHADSNEIIPLPLEKREVTSLLVRTRQDIFAESLRYAINKNLQAPMQAVYPVMVIYNLFDFIVKPVQQMLLFLTVMICAVSGLSILVSIYNSMSDRRHEIAVMRALGASQWRIFWIVLYEAMLLAVGGGLLGYFLAQVVIFALSGPIENQTGVQVSMFQMEPRLADLLAVFSTEVDTNDESWFMRMPAVVVLIPLVLTIAVAVGVWPAISAYRTDVAKSLGK